MRPFSRQASSLEVRDSRVCLWEGGRSMGTLGSGAMVSGRLGAGLLALSVASSAHPPACAIGGGSPGLSSRVAGLA